MDSDNHDPSEIAISYGSWSDPEFAPYRKFHILTIMAISKRLVHTYNRSTGELITGTDTVSVEGLSIEEARRMLETLLSKMR
jgi:hypothetical protein